MRKFIVLLLLLTAGYFVHAREPDALERLGADFRSCFRDMDSILFSDGSGTTFRMPAASRESIPTPLPLWVDSLLYVKQAGEERALRRDLGLELTGQIYKRFDIEGTPAYDLAEDAATAYTARAQLSLNWNIFQSSLYQRCEKRRLISLRNEQLHLTFTAQEAERERAQRVLEIERTWAARITAVLQLRDRLLEMSERATRVLGEERLVRAQRLLGAISARSQIAEELASYADSGAGSPPLADNFVAGTAILTVVDRARLVSAIEEYNPRLQESDLRSQVLATQHALSNYGATVRLTPFVRAAYYFRTGNRSGSTNLDAGLNFSLPLTNPARQKKRAIAAEISLESYNRSLTLADLLRRADALILRHERLAGAMRAVDAERSARKELIASKAEAWAGDLPYNYFERVDEYDAYLRTLERLFRLELQRDVLLAELQELAPGCRADRYIGISPVQETY